MKKRTLYCLTIAFLILAGNLIGCGQTIPDTPPQNESIHHDSQTLEAPEFSEEDSTPGPQSESIISDNSENFSESIPESIPESTLVSEENPVTLRDNTPICLIPTADGTAETHNDVASIDFSNTSYGYVMANYTGTCPKVKIRVTGPDGIIYTYDLHGSSYETFPLSSGSGNYDVTIYENISGTDYATCLYQQVQVQLVDEFTPFLYPNQYVNYNPDSKTVAKGAELASTAENDLDVVTSIYDYITSSITYDYNKASAPPTGYTANVDEILESGTGICLDYAAVMATMLRSQGIPTRLEVGYAQDAYHAWISVYIDDIGWVNGIIEFDGSTWTLMDPTFGANTDNTTLKKFIGDGSNYVLQKMY